jgi:hypothetical protein
MSSCQLRSEAAIYAVMTRIMFVVSLPNDLLYKQPLRESNLDLKIGCREQWITRQCSKLGTRTQTRSGTILVIK